MKGTTIPLRLMYKKFGTKLKTTDKKYSGDQTKYEPIIDQIFMVFKRVLIVRKKIGLGREY
jgi:hypothetical protein